MRRGGARVLKRVLEITAFRMKFWLCTVWEEIFVPIKPYLHLKRVRRVAHAFDIDFDLRNQYSCSTRLQFGTNLTTDRKKDQGFTNHFWSILYFQINPTKKIGRILYRHAYRYTIQVSASSIHIWNLQANVHPCRLPG